MDVFQRKAWTVRLPEPKKVQACESIYVDILLGSVRECRSIWPGVVWGEVVVLLVSSHMGKIWGQEPVTIKVNVCQFTKESWEQDPKRHQPQNQTLMLSLSLLTPCYQCHTQMLDDMLHHFSINSCLTVGKCSMFGHGMWRCCKCTSNDLYVCVCQWHIGTCVYVSVRNDTHTHRHRDVRTRTNVSLAHTNI